MPDTDDISGLRTASNPLQLLYPRPELLRKLRQQQGAVTSALGQATGISDAYAALRGEQTPEEAQTFALGALPMLVGAPEEAAAKGVGTAVEDLLPGASNMIRAYHGSPYDFDQFDISKIGTGEGAQAYGHGLYFAENPEVAKAYDPRKPAPTNAISRAAGEKGTPGKMYEVGIKGSPEEFLDWDKPISEQSKHVQDAIKRLGDPHLEKYRQDLAGLYGNIPKEDLDKLMSTSQAKTPGRDVYHALARGDRPNPLVELAQGTSSDWRIDPARATQKLKEAGIKGIRYLDQGSRGKDPNTGTSNYVVFDDKTIDIIRKYGIAGLIAAGGVGGIDAMHQAEAGEIKPPLQIDPLVQEQQQTASEFVYDEHGNLVHENKSAGMAATPLTGAQRNARYREKLKERDPEDLPVSRKPGYQSPSSAPEAIAERVRRWRERQKAKKLEAQDIDPDLLRYKSIFDRPPNSPQTLDYKYRKPRAENDPMSFFT